MSNKTHTHIYHPGSNVSICNGDGSVVIQNNTWDTTRPFTRVYNAPGISSKMSINIGAGSSLNNTRIETQGDKLIVSYLGETEISKVPEITLNTEEIDIDCPFKIFSDRIETEDYVHINEGKISKIQTTNVADSSWTKVIKIDSSKTKKLSVSGEGNISITEDFLLPESLCLSGKISLEVSGKQRIEKILLLDACRLKLRISESSKILIVQMSGRTSCTINSPDVETISVLTSGNARAEIFTPNAIGQIQTSDFSGVLFQSENTKSVFLNSSGQSIVSIYAPEARVVGSVLKKSMTDITSKTVHVQKSDTSTLLNICG